jgi:opacity protein-like surface antigen
MKRILIGGTLLLAAMSLLVGPAAAQSTSGAASLLITPGARADGMGRAFVALPTDATANWWNPAALALEKGRVFSLMHAQLVPDLADDVYYENLGYAMHLPGWGGIGATLIYLGYGKSMATTEEGYELGYFTSYEISPQVSIGTEAIPGIAAGLTLKYVYVNLAPSWATQDQQPGTGDTFAADLATLIRLKELVPAVPIPVNLGLNVQNLGPRIAYIDQDQADPIGRNFKLGIGVQFLNLPNLTGIASYDYNKSLVYVNGLGEIFSNTEERPIHNFGSEITYSDFVSGRFGYIQDKDGDIIDPTFGLGFVLDIGSKSNLAFDYASVPQAKVLDRVNKFSISFRF